MRLKDYKQLPEKQAVYGIYNMTTEKWYIGSTLNLRNRFMRHIYYLKYNNHHSTKLQRSFSKYKIEDFNICILYDEECTIDLLIKKEINFIDKYKSVSNGYNMIRDCRKYKQFQQSEEAKNKAGRSHYIPIICLTTDGEFVKEYESITQASKEIKEQTTNLSQACKSNCRRTCRGFMFLYKKDYNKTKQYKYIEYKMSDDHKDKISKAASNQTRNRKIYELDSEDDIITIYNSIKEFERSFNMKKDSLKTFLYKEYLNESVFNLHNRKFKIEKSHIKI